MEGWNVVKGKTFRKQRTATNIIAIFVTTLKFLRAKISAVAPNYPSVNKSSTLFSEQYTVNWGYLVKSFEQLFHNKHQNGINNK